MYFFLRFMTTSAANCAPSMKTTAFLINSSVFGMGLTGKKGSVAGSLPKVGPLLAEALGGLFSVGCSQTDVKVRG